MTTRLGSGRGTLVGRGVALPVPIALEPAAYAGAYAYGEDGLVYYCDGATWLHPEGRRPHRVVTSAYTAVLADAGRLVSISVGSVTIPAGVFRLGDKFSVLNNSMQTRDVLPGAGVTLYLGGSALTGPQTISPRGLVTIDCVAPNEFVMSGNAAVQVSPEGITLVAPNFIAAPLNFERAQAAGVRSTAFDLSGSLTFFGADAPRFNGVAQGLSIERQTTNNIRNPNLEGAVAGTPGTAPTNYLISQAGFSSLSAEVVAVGVENNMNYFDVRWYGTTNAAGRLALFLENAGLIIPASIGQTFTHSIYAKIIAGTYPTTDSVFGVQENTAGVGTNAIPLLAAAPPGNPSDRLSACRLVSVPHTVSTAPTNAIRPSWRSGTIGSEVAVDVTIRFAAPQTELGATATSPVLPPVGTTAAATRGADIVGAALSQLGISGNGAGTVLWTGMVPIFEPAGLHTLACLDDASINNRVTMRINQTSGQLEVMRALNGTAVTANVGAVTAGIRFKAGMSLDGAGRVAASLNGGAIATVTGGPASGLTRFRLGNIADLSSPLNGDVTRLRVLPFTVSDAELQSLVGGLP
jgi:hypothetical protein